MATEHEYVVTWRIRATRGGYRDSGESTVMAESEQQAKDRVIGKLYNAGRVDYPSEVEVTETRLK